jgi:hypothetical protein
MRYHSKGKKERVNIVTFLSILAESLTYSWCSFSTWPRVTSPPVVEGAGESGN